MEDLAPVEPHRTSRRTHLLGLAAASGLLWGQGAQARSTGLDLPACRKLKSAGGMQYCDVRPGTGDSPQSGDQIEVNYTARVADSGKIYDGSRGFEFTLGNNEVVPGWEAAILGKDGMPPIKEGGLRTVVIPAEMAFGAKGEGCLFGLDEKCRVPPNAAIEITFEYLGLGYYS
ncbi:hypothetical protein WJX72_009477 [[Myrmecia] bisecta]|uniref:peptidylprolyl isomerase n=1 Tax=[Myrmecia] bisecta TaxID=41462 RepID=A0AAW1R8V5_9CHLO